MAYTVDVNHVNSAVPLAVGALLISGATPFALMFFQRRAGKRDARKNKAQEESHREEIAAAALKLAKHNLITASMEYELEALQHAMSAIKDAIILKQEAEIPVSQLTHDSLLSIREHARVLEIEIFDRKENV
jgi:hypothetical protein